MCIHVYVWLQTVTIVSLSLRNSRSTIFATVVKFCALVDSSRSVGRSIGPSVGPSVGSVVPKRVAICLGPCFVYFFNPHPSLGIVYRRMHMRRSHPSTSLSGKLPSPKMAEPAFRGRSSDGAGKAAVWGSLESNTLPKNKRRKKRKQGNKKEAISTA